MTADHDFLDNLANHQHQKMLREIANDDLTPKKTDSMVKMTFMSAQMMILRTMDWIMTPMPYLLQNFS